MVQNLGAKVADHASRLGDITHFVCCPAELLRGASGFLGTPVVWRRIPGLHVEASNSQAVAFKEESQEQFLVSQLQHLKAWKVPNIRVYQQASKVVRACCEAPHTILVARITRPRAFCARTLKSSFLAQRVLNLSQRAAFQKSSRRLAKQCRNLNKRFFN